MLSKQNLKLLKQNELDDQLCRRRDTFSMFSKYKNSPSDYALKEAYKN